LSENHRGDFLTHTVQGGPAKVRPTYIFAGTWMCR